MIPRLIASAFIRFMDASICLADASISAWLAFSKGAFSGVALGLTDARGVFAFRHSRPLLSLIVLGFCWGILSAA